MSSVWRRSIIEAVLARQQDFAPADQAGQSGLIAETYREPARRLHQAPAGSRLWSKAMISGRSCWSSAR
jgi:hypothetical protein